MVRERVMVVGGGYAGVLAALRLARRSRALGLGLEVVLVTARPWFDERIRLHQVAAGEDRPRRSMAALLDGTEVELVVGFARRIELGERRVALETDGGSRRVESFDQLVLATGSTRSVSGVPGLAHALSCADAEHAAALRARLDEAPSSRVVVVGGGLTATELVTELAERRPRLGLTLVTAGDLAPSCSPAARAHVRRALARLGVTVRESARVVAIEPDAVVLASGAALPADTTVWAGGFSPSSLARESGLATDASGRALVDDRLVSTSHAFVHVAGDSARTPTELRMACATAMPMGAFAADDLVRAYRREAPRPFAFAFSLQCVSLGRRDGLAQHVDARDAPSSLWLGRRAGAWIKEGICRYTVASMSLERAGFGFRWPRGPATAELPA